MSLVGLCIGTLVLVWHVTGEQYQYFSGTTDSAAHNLWTLAVREIYGWSGVPKAFAEDFILSVVNRANTIATRVL